MPNPFAGSAFYARLGNLFTRPLWNVLPAPKGFGILTTTGRRTGRPRRQSVRALRRGDHVFVVCMMGERAHWMHNIRADPQATIETSAMTAAVRPPVPGRSLERGNPRVHADRAGAQAAT